MKSHFWKNERRNVWFPAVLGILVLVTTSILSRAAQAQGTPEPQLVTAYDDSMLCGISSTHIRRYIKIYNVGAAGGPEYAQAIFGDQNFVQPDAFKDECTPTDYRELIGTFSGGPNGTITFPIPNDLMGYYEVTSCQVIDGKTIDCLEHYTKFGQEDTSWHEIFTIQNPEAFLAAENPPQNVSENPTAGGLGCTPKVYGLAPQKPGETISPGASYTDSTGKEVGIIQERWFFNGKEGTSTIWDGKPLSVELQWTCLDHSASSATYTIPAYVEGAPVTTTNTSPGESKTISQLRIATYLAAILSVLGAAGAGVGILIQGKTPTSAPAAPAGSNQPAFRSPAGIPAAAPSSPPPQIPPPVNPPYSQVPAQQAKLTPERRVELINIRGQMENEIANLKSRWRSNKDAIAKLTRLKKKNMLKFIFKKGFDVQNWLMNSPAEVISKVTIDQLMDKAFEKHDTSQDANIIVTINNRIEAMKVDMQQMTDQVRYLQSEIAKINKMIK